MITQIKLGNTDLTVGNVGLGYAMIEITLHLVNL